MEIVEPLIAIVTAMKVYFVTVDCCGVVIPARWLLAECFRLASADEIVEVQYVQVVQRLLTIPSPEDVKVV